MVNEKLIQKILEFLNEKHFSGQPMHYFTVDEIVKGAKLKKMNIDEVTGTMLYLLNKNYVKGLRQMGVAHPTSIYITEKGIEKLDNLKKDPNEKPKDTQIQNITADVVTMGNDNTIKVNSDNATNINSGNVSAPTSNAYSKGQLIATIVIGAFVIAGVVWGFSLYSIEDKNIQGTLEIDECVTGEDGLTIRNCALGIELTRPNIKWIVDIEYESFSIPQSILPDTDYNILGSTIIGKKGSASLTIRVFETKQLTDQDFEIFAKNFHEELKRVYPTFEHPEPFIVGKTAIIEMTASMDLDAPYISQYQIENHDDRIYVFLDTVRTDRSNVNETISELKQIHNSFTYLK